MTGTAGGAPASAPPAPVVVLVEGVSDAAVVGVLARRCGIALAGVRVLPSGGATGAARALAGLDPVPERVLALCDEGEAAHVRGALARFGVPSALFVCRADLEDELLRAAGERIALDALRATGTLRAFRTLQGQPAHRLRPFDRQLHRFIGAGSGRKTLLGAALAERIDPVVAAPLAALLDRLQSTLLPLGPRPPAAG